MPDHAAHIEALRQAALAVSTAEGERVFDDLVAALARILGVEFALISVYVEPQRTVLRTLASFFDGKPARNMEYPVAGTPCEMAIGRAFGHYPRGVAKLVKRADAVAETLGDDHDLAMLRRRLGHADRELIAWTDRRRRKLQKRALKNAGQLYRRKPKEFIRESKFL